MTGSKVRTTFTAPSPARGREFDPDQPRPFVVTLMGDDGVRYPHVLFGSSYWDVEDCGRLIIAEDGWSRDTVIVEIRVLTRAEYEKLFAKG